MGKHDQVKYLVLKIGDFFQVCFAGTGSRVPGTPAYARKKDAEAHVERLNHSR